MHSRWPFSVPLCSSESDTPVRPTHVRLIMSDMREMAEVYFHMSQLCCFKLTEIQFSSSTRNKQVWFGSGITVVMIKRNHHRHHQSSTFFLFVLSSFSEGHLFFIKN